MTDRGGGGGVEENKARPHQTTAELNHSVSVSQNTGYNQTADTKQTTALRSIKHLPNTRDTTNCEGFLCLPISIIRATEKAIGGDAHPIGAGCCNSISTCDRGPPKHFAFRRKKLNKMFDKLPLCGAVWTHRTVSSAADVLWRWL